MENNLIISYLTQRKLIGILGIALAFICIIGGLIATGTVETSISAYYYTVMRDAMVGVLVMAGAFLLTYKGYDLKDNIVSSISGVSAIGIAFFPMNGIHVAHFTFAGIFFVSLAYMSYFQFSKGSDKKRNLIYRICGIIILASIILFPILNNVSYSVLILEIIMLFAFGTSWLTKGKTISKNI